MPPKANTAAMKRRNGAKILKENFDESFAIGNNLIASLQAGNVSRFTIDKLSNSFAKLEEIYGTFRKTRDDIITLNDEEDIADFVTRFLEVWSEQLKQDFLKFSTDCCNSIAAAEQALDEAEANSRKTTSPRKKATSNLFGDDEDPKDRPQRMKLIESLKPKITLTPNLSALEYEAWARAFELYFNASNCDAESLDIQRGVLESCMDHTMTTILLTKCRGSIPIFSENPEDLNCIMNVIKNEFKQSCPWFNRFTDFLTYVQPSNMPYSEWIAKKRQYSYNANMSEITEEKLLCGLGVTQVYDASLQRKLVEKVQTLLREEDKMKLEGQPVPANYCLDGMLQCASEFASVAKTVSANNASREEAKAATSGTRNGNWKTGSSTSKPVPQNLPPRPSFALFEEKPPKICSCCGSRDHKGKECEFKKAADCSKCSIKRSHLTHMCFREEIAAKHAKNKAEKDKGTSEKANRVEEVTARVKNPGGQQPIIDVFCYQKDKCLEQKALCDSGATTSVFPWSDFKDNKLKYYPAPDTSLTMANGEQMDVSGRAEIEITFEGQSHFTEVLVSKDTDIILMSTKDMKAMKILPPEFPHVACRATEEPDNWETILEQGCKRLKMEFEDVFDAEELKTIKCEPMSLKFREDVPIKPIFISTNKDVPVHYQEAVDKIVASELKQSIIERVPRGDTSKWCFRASFVEKAGSTPENPKLRPVIDLSPLNPQLELGVHPFLSCAEVKRRIPHDARVFMRLDFKSGYHQIPVDEEARKVFTFLYPGGRGRFRYTRAPMGCSASSHWFCRITDEALEDLQDKLCKMVDDLTIWGRTPEELLENARIVLQRCRDWNITLNGDKMEAGKICWVFDLRQRHRDPSGPCRSHQGLPDPHRPEIPQIVPRVSQPSDELPARP